MPTKFHHYIFPALPAVAVLVGLLLDRPRSSWRAAPPRAPRSARRRSAAPRSCCSSRGISRSTGGDRRGAAPQPGDLQLRAPLARHRERARGARGVRRGVRRDPGGDGGAAAAARGDVRLLSGAARVRGVGLDGYLVRVAPHWGSASWSRRTTGRARARRTRSRAYNMNWKGENFYTGNRVAVFPAGGRFLTWIEARRKAGAKAVFFLTEPGGSPRCGRRSGTPRLRRAHRRKGQQQVRAGAGDLRVRRRG